MHYLSKLIRNAFNPFEVLLHELISRGGPLPPGAGPMELASLAAGGMPMDPSMMGMGMMGEWDHYTAELRITVSCCRDPDAQPVLRPRGHALHCAGGGGRDA